MSRTSFLEGKKTCVIKYIIVLLVFRSIVIEENWRLLLGSYFPSATVGVCEKGWRGEGGARPDAAITSAS